MKKIITFISILAAAFTLSSCEDFLTKAPETYLSPETFFSTSEELEMWTNKFYNDLLPAADDLAELNADDQVSASSLTGIQKGTRTPTSTPWSLDMWKALRRINYMLENNKCPDEATKKMYDGVCYFFRAWFYYYRVRVFGDFPWYDHVVGSTDSLDLKKPRDPRGYVMLKAIQDLDKAYELLPAKWSSDPVYHVSKDAALALKSRIALFEGTFRKYHAGTPYVPQDVETYDGITISSEWFLRQAADAAGKMLGTRKLYNGNTLKLAPKAVNASYREYFVLEDAETDETILARRYNVGLLIRHGIQFDFANQRRSATARFVNHYLQSDGTPIQERSGWETLSYYDVFQNRDSRMAQSLHGPSYVAVGAKEHEMLDFSKRTFNGYRIIKYISDDTHETATTSTTDFPILRYAEVLLNYAEAKAELGELTTEDIDKTINVIRARVGMPKMTAVPTNEDPLMASYYPNAKGAQKAAILEVRRERTVELFCEGLRQWDLLRWGEGKWLTPKANGGMKGIYIPALGEYDLDGNGSIDVLFYTGSKPKTSAPAANHVEIGGSITLSEGNKGYLTYYAAEDYDWVETRDYLWPIPAEQRTLTHGSLTQNPGWDDGVSFND